MSVLKTAFNTVLDLNAVSAQIHNLNTDTKVTIKITSANYFRNLAGFEEVVIEGKEFVISKSVLDSASFSAPQRGDKLIQTDGTVDTITYIKELVAMGEVIGYRVRTQ